MLDECEATRFRSQQFSTSPPDGMVVASLNARGGGSLGRGMQASGDWANLPTATGPIGAVPCPGLHEPGSHRNRTQSVGLAHGLSQETSGVQYSAMSVFASSPPGR
jgi:hypothetical protein